jgi:predicted nuclease with TOPRIM domain
MKEQLLQRLNELKSEFEAGQKMLADLEAKQANLRDTLLRISGAIQVLEELLKQAQSIEANGDSIPETPSVLPQLH